MDRYKIERNFTSIGRSFYSGEEYKDLNISYKPISNLGIGFLSVFMVCREIDVKTKYFIDNSEGLKLHIPNYDGCFFIEPKFYSESFAFRPNRNCHQAVKQIIEMVQYCKTNYVVEADNRGFFDSVDHDWLMQMLRHDITDKRFLETVGKISESWCHGLYQWTTCFNCNQSAFRGRECLIFFFT